ncbi:MAG: hypothetical protein QOE90_784 [Thermoplasmata archaeon]|jgi:hypothetical protein|nr:hypothetical protein [Thermoplasmata archaeon]
MRAYAISTLQLAAQMGCTAADADRFGAAYREATARGIAAEDALRAALRASFPELSAEGAALYEQRFADPDAAGAIVRLARTPPALEG